MFESREGQNFFSSSKLLEGHWGPRSLLFNGHRGPISGVKRPVLVPRLRMSGDVRLRLLYSFTVWTGTPLPYVVWN